VASLTENIIGLNLVLKFDDKNSLYEFSFRWSLSVTYEIMNYDFIFMALFRIFMSRHIQIYISNTRPCKVSYTNRDYGSRLNGTFKKISFCNKVPILGWYIM
jgi:hypothetical protein